MSSRHRIGAASEDVRRPEILARALLLVSISVLWGAVWGGVSVTLGVIHHSLGVLGLGLNMLADLAASGVLIWRFRAELRHASHPESIEARSAVVVATALGMVSVVLAGGATHALAVGSRAGSSVLAMVSAGLACVVLSPLAYAKRRVASALGSRALRGDATLSGIGAAVGLLALAGLVLERSLGWWWADRVAALVVAAGAAAEAIRVGRRAT